MANEIISLSSTDAKEFFLWSKCYCEIDFPTYFDFHNLLKELDNAIDGKTDIEQICDPSIYLHKVDCGPNMIDIGKEKINLPSKMDKVNYVFYHNKDGNYAWRKFQLINPALYILLVNVITNDTNWTQIQKCFKAFQKNNKIKCCSIPFNANEEKNVPAQSATNWWKMIELQSIDLSLKFNWLAVTDITDCYGSLYTHSIAWAVNMDIEISKKNRNKELLGNKIDYIIQSMSYGQTNGIPQGCVLMDFIAEIVLGFADMLLSKEIENNINNDYQIIRYRDDYRIFTETKEDAVVILQLLSKILSTLNFKLNTQKTFVSQEVITDSIKPDKLFWNRSKQDDSNLQKHLMLIHNLAKEHSNSGSIKKALSCFIDKITPSKMAKTENKKNLIAILADIAFKNSNVYSQVVVAIGQILSYIKDKKTKQEIFEQLQTKFNQLPNNSFLTVWLQRLALKTDLQFEKNSDALCNIVNGTQNNSSLWECCWLNSDLKDIVEKSSIINASKLENLPPVPDDDEAKLFISRY